MTEMHDMQRRMEDLKNQYAQDKETYRIQLVSSLLQAKKTQVNTEVKNWALAITFPINAMLLYTNRNHIVISNRIMCVYLTSEPI